MEKEHLTIATIFAGLENIHLIKDPGMIPFTLHRYFGYNAIIPLSSLKTYSYKDMYFKDIETPIINDKDNINIKYILRLKWLISNAKRIDLLNIFFFDRWTWIFIFVYRLINPHGRIYVHVDTDGERLLDYCFTKNKAKKYIIEKYLLSENNLNSTLWGIQNKKNTNKLKGTWPFYNVKFIPDGVYWEHDIDVKYEDKENIILTVARNGTAPKRTDILLNGFAGIANEYPEWYLKIIGPVEDKFKSFIDNYFEKYPYLKERVLFMGEINDRNKLENEYAMAKIFCITSDWESFGLVTAEAMSKGCCVIGSDIPATSELTDNGKYGVLFEKGNLQDFILKLKMVIDDESYIKRISNSSINYIEKNYKWKSIVNAIDDWMRNEV